MSRESLVLLTKICEQAERLDNMVEPMKRLAHLGVELTVEERNLLSIAFKNYISRRRSSWRILNTITKETTQNTEKFDLVKEISKTVEKELFETCNEVIDLINNNLLPKVSSTESKVFYYKMKGDYYRYLAEFQTGNEKKDSTQSSKDAYESATQLASTELKPTNPIRLGLALNYSVFLYEINEEQIKAYNHAKTAFEGAIAEIGALEESSYQDSTLVMQLLRDNLAVWGRESCVSSVDDQ